MKDFFFHLPTEILFGKEQFAYLSRMIEKNNGKKILLVYGKGSAYKNGAYEKTIKALQKGNFKIFELKEIPANPGLEKIIEGQEICIREKIDFILALGGGSVIDTAKIIAISPFIKGNIADIFSQKKKIKKALPMAAIPTIFGSASEINNGAVITIEGKGKVSYHSNLLYPKFALINPEFCQSLPKKYIASALSDSIAHILEFYFDKEISLFSLEMALTMLRNIILLGEKAYFEEYDYDVFAEIFLISSFAMSGLLKLGTFGNWTAHLISHELNRYEDRTHGELLAIIFPQFMKMLLEKKDIAKITELGKKVFALESDNIAENTISSLQDFYQKLNLPQKVENKNLDYEKVTDNLFETHGGLFAHNGFKKNDLLKIFEKMILADE